MVTTAGGIEEDLIKCLAPTYKGDFSLPGDYLCSEGLNKIGNLLVPNDKLTITANLRTGLDYAKFVPDVTWTAYRDRADHFKGFYSVLFKCL